MKRYLSTRLMTDLTDSVQSALRSQGIVNIPLIAEEVRKRNEAENVALEDIAAQVMMQAQVCRAAMIFETTTLN